ncbi:bifunctional heptose 7-phosphate kinase/heptose 1-phosphate adenyltransferase [Ktedonospora formicarum]|uniref:ADP-heptose synthase n=1 Tax=Ktedonospora formicarum TaxID=2778364 RepID=A0A8J3HTE8_9CHLR|nr:bifunctional ADP-heptose synthase [Ktedonospora formicarum]GHO43652.1 ADP-heptose synthase [Ktedonospora formicarum]
MTIQSVDPSRLKSIIAAFQGKRVLVIGDMVVDEYLIGRPARIAREAPVLLLELEEELTILGGAANVAVNVNSLGADVYLAGVIGDDVHGRRFRSAVRELGIHDEGLVHDGDRPTSTKTRVMAGSTQVVRQHIVRVDRVDKSGIGEDCRDKLCEYIKAVLPEMDAIVLSDYEIGMISPKIIETCVPLARELKKVIVADSHGSLDRFQGVTALTPNQPEVELSLGETIETSEDLDRAGQRLLDECNAQSVLVTRGSEGMSLFEANHPPVHLPVYPLEAASNVVDPNGAGDTVAATFTLSLTGGASKAEAAYLANVAAALVVRRLGCASNTPEELVRVIR